jgi:DNA-binding XRE family transcriptional regulator
MRILKTLFGPPSIEKLKEKRDVDGLIGALRHTSFLRRRGAAKALGELQDTRAVTALCASLKDEDTEMRLIAADSLGSLGDVRAVPALIEALMDTDFPMILGSWHTVHQHAIDALARIGSPAMDQLLAALGDWDSGPRIQFYGSTAPAAHIRAVGAVGALGKIGDPRAIRAVMAIPYPFSTARVIGEAIGRLVDVAMLRRLREEAGLRQVDLAKALGRPQSFVSSYEAGKQALDLQEVLEICKALNVSFEALVQRLERS